jgi:hypothetical protein
VGVAVARENQAVPAEDFAEAVEDRWMGNEPVEFRYGESSVWLMQT